MFIKIQFTYLFKRKTVKVEVGVIINGENILAIQWGYEEFKDGWEFSGGKLKLEKVLKKH